MISAATKPEFGDYQVNAAMSLFKLASGYSNPREFAMGLVERLQPMLGDAATLEVAGPGFVNVRLTDDYLRGAVGIMSRDCGAVVVGKEEGGGGGGGGRLGVPMTR